MKIKAVILLLVVLPTLGLADGSIQAEEKFLETARTARERGQSKVEQMLKPKPPQTVSKDVHGSYDLQDEISSLLSKVDRLKTRAVITKRNALSTRTAREQPDLGAVTEYVYSESEVYEVHTARLRTTEIVLQPGEELTSAPLSGDTRLFEFAVIEAGSSAGRRRHVLVKPKLDDIETNLIIPTNRRTYRLQVVETGEYMPAVSFRYPEDERREIEKSLAKKEQEIAINTDPTSLRYGYEIEGDRVKWRPAQVFDDGEKTYIQFKDSIKNIEAPAVFVLDEAGEATLIVPRAKKGTFLVLDRIFEQAELRVGEKKVRIISPDYERSFWDAIF